MENELDGENPEIKGFNFPILELNKQGSDYLNDPAVIFFYNRILDKYYERK